VKALVIGSGGREHTLAWALSRDSKIDELYAAPGNPGIAEVAKCVPINTTKIDDLASFAKRNKIDLTVVGPEQPLALGIVDVFQKQELLIFGPDQKAARIETSKSFAKNLCSKFHIPTPKWQAFSKAREAIDALEQFGPPWVVKADGLAAGKGTTVTRDRRDAEEAVKRELTREGGRVLFEEFIDGWEATFMDSLIRKGPVADSSIPRLQARVRRRPWSKHWRHGRLHSSPHGHTLPPRECQEFYPDADGRSNGENRSAFPRSVEPQCNHQAWDRRSVRVGVQRPLRRP